MIPAKIPADWRDWTRQGGEGELLCRCRTDYHSLPRCAAIRGVLVLGAYRQGGLVDLVSSVLGMAPNLPA